MCCSGLSTSKWATPARPTVQPSSASASSSRSLLAPRALQGGLPGRVRSCCQLRVAAAAAAAASSSAGAAAGQGGGGAVDAAAAFQHIVPFRRSQLVGGQSDAAVQLGRPLLSSPEEPAPSSWPTAAARQGLYSDVAVDRVDGLHTLVLGKLPAWLEGSYYRNGPGKFGGAHAVFDGCAMLVRFRVDGPSNSVVLSHRFLDSIYRRAAQEQGSIRWRMAHPPAGSLGTLKGLAYAGGMALGTLQYGIDMGDNALVTIVAQGSELIAHTETVSGTFRVHPETLETLGRVHYRDGIHGMVKTAHLNRLPNGDFVGLCSDFTPTYCKETLLLQVPEITVFRQSPWQSDRRQKIAAVPYMRPTAPTWIHEVPVSERYAVVVQNPVFYNVRAMVLGQTAQYMCFDWRPEFGSLLHVVPLMGGQVKTYHAPAFLAAHWVNAFEEGNQLLHLDGVVADTPELMSHWELGTVRAGPESGQRVPDSRLRRLTIDLSQPDGSFLGQQPLLQPLVPDAAYGHAFELPTIAPGSCGRPYRYTYGTCCQQPTNSYNALCKLDVLTGEVKVWHEAGGATGEPIFAPRPGGRAEDDGCVLAPIVQPDGRSALLVLDAKSWREVARAVVPYALPTGFHGCWCPA